MDDLEERMKARKLCMNSGSIAFPESEERANRCGDAIFKALEYQFPLWKSNPEKEFKDKGLVLHRSEPSKEFDLQGFVHAQHPGMYDTEYKYEMRFRIEELPQELYQTLCKALQDSHGRSSILIDCKISDTIFRYNKIKETKETLTKSITI